MFCAHTHIVVWILIVMTHSIQNQCKNFAANSALDTRNIYLAFCTIAIVCVRVVLTDSTKKKTSSKCDIQMRYDAYFFFIIEFINSQISSLGFSLAVKFQWQNQKQKLPRFATINFEKRLIREKTARQQQLQATVRIHKKIMCRINTWSFFQ